MNSDVQVILHIKHNACRRMNNNSDNWYLEWTWPCGCGTTPVRLKHGTVVCR